MCRRILIKNFPNQLLIFWSFRCKLIVEKTCSKVFIVTPRDIPRATYIQYVPQSAEVSACIAP